jgi:hypothetical protein
MLQHSYSNHTHLRFLWGNIMAKAKARSSITPTYSFGESYVNPYLGNKITEVLDAKKARAGWIWTHTDSRVVVSPHLGLYVWFNEGGVEWTMETAAAWLVKSR